MTERLLNQYRPEVVSAPGETLAEVLADRGMSQAELAERMGRPKKTISEIIGGKAELMPETALQLERVLSVPASFWSNLERNFRDSLARAAEKQELLKHADWPRRFPLAQMEEYDLIPRESDPVERIRSLLAYFAVSTVEQWQSVYQGIAVAYRRPARFEPDLYALTAWLRAGEREAQSMECASFDLNAFRAALVEARALTTVIDPKLFVPQLQALMCRCGVAVAFVPELKGSRASGATRWLGAQRALIQLSLRYKSNDHLWFTFFHEAGHIALHGKRGVFVEFHKGSTGTEAREAEADQFAAEILIPRRDLQLFLAEGRPSEARVRSFASECGIAPGIVVGRLQHEEVLPYSHLNAIKIWYDWKLSED